MRQPYIKPPADRRSAGGRLAMGLLPCRALITAAAAKNNDDSQDYDPGAVIVKEVAEAVVVHSFLHFLRFFCETLKMSFKALCCLKRLFLPPIFIVCAHRFCVTTAAQNNKKTRDNDLCVIPCLRYSI